MKPTILIMALMLGMIRLVGAGTFSMKFTDVELRNEYGSTSRKTKGKLIVDRHRICFQKKTGEDLFEIQTWTIKGIFYTRVSARRLIESTAITGSSFVGMIVAAFTEASAAIKIVTGLAGTIGSAFVSANRAQKHYMVLAFDDGGERVGAVEFKLDKNNYRSCLRAIAQVTGQPILYGLEGVVEPY